MDNAVPIIRCGMYITRKKRPKFGYDDFVAIAKQHGVVIVDLDLDGDHDKLPNDLHCILHKVGFELQTEARSHRNANIQQYEY
jgi:predicted site-specific integrase-resolvase